MHSLSPMVLRREMLLEWTGWGQILERRLMLRRVSR